MRRRGGHRRRRRQLRGPGGGVSRADRQARAHAGPRRTGWPTRCRAISIRRIEDNPAIVLRTHTEIVALEGNGHLERVRWRDNRTGSVETHDIRHVFMMTGAVPNTRWLDRCVVLDDKGFIKTGPDLSQDDLAAAGWPLTRPPYLLETSRPGRLCGRRCARRQHQARRLRRRRGINCRRLRPSGASPVNRTSVPAQNPRLQRQHAVGAPGHPRIR